MNIYDKISWDTFMARHDLVWNEIPHIWYEAPFLGNGFMGATFCFSESGDRMLVNLGHTCIYDNRPIEDIHKDDKMYLRPRLPIGKISIKFKGKVTDVNLRLDIYNARLFGEIATTEGKVNIDCMIFNNADCLMLEHNEKNETAEFNYIPSIAQSPRYNAGIVDNEEAYARYGEPKQGKAFAGHGLVAYMQPFYCGGGFCVSNASLGNKFFVSVNYDNNSTDNLVNDGINIIKKTAENLKSYVSRHLEWWHSFYQRSFLSLNSGVYESFYYIQLYKLACASRENGRPYDTCGPWLSDTTRWPGTWWNLNVELSISPLYTSNHIDIAHCVNNALKNGFDELIQNVPEKYRNDCAALGRCTTSSMYAPVAEPGKTDVPNSEREGGNLIWTLYYIWQEYKITGDESLLTEIVYPLLKRAVKFYSYFLYKGDDGDLHLPSTISPEYLKADSPDVNYDLQLLTWGCITLLEIINILGIDDKDKREWNRILKKLTEFPQQPEEGLFIAAETPYAESHRHYSHLVGFYPLHIFDENDEEDRKLITTSIKYWQSKPEALLGYSQTGAASMYAMLGDGNKALSHLKNLWKGFIQPNTMYHEDGNPVIETPPSAATSILDMLIQSHAGYINIFPAIPDEWTDICFDGLLCQGGFEVGACMRNGRLEWIKIKSRLGKRCFVKADFAESLDFCDTEYRRHNNGTLEVFVKAGQTAVLSTVQSPMISPAPVSDIETNCYGLNKRNKEI